MDNYLNNPPGKKKLPQPSNSDIVKANYFEVQILDVALTAYKNKQYLKSAMMSWSFVEEFFLPTVIEYIAKKQNISFKRDLIESSVNHLIKYYYFISYDEDLYELLEKARTLRNEFVHKSYKSGSIEQIAKQAKESAKYNIHTLIGPILDRLSGKVTVPSLTLYANGWNDMRSKMLKDLEKRKRELEKELENLKNHK